ncbi:hypothetical protein [Parasulfitobacter algicola]|uniref:Uncharacterized protein n=1 Tax=Parasulfitobacter algicola TaxID=2614809 RepID=A0ABX2IUM5_9RHOB|nr:hypothetical protein [Sulfitobacter algicola]NSX56599.1 hypothetical protein [Sulfitobacter algicola]
MDFQIFSIAFGLLGFASAVFTSIALMIIYRFTGHSVGTSLFGLTPFLGWFISIIAWRFVNMMAASTESVFLYQLGVQAIVMIVSLSGLAILMFSIALGKAPLVMKSGNDQVAQTYE